MVNNFSIVALLQDTMAASYRVGVLTSLVEILPLYDDIVVKHEKRGWEFERASACLGWGYYPPVMQTDTEEILRILQLVPCKEKDINHPLFVHIKELGIGDQYLEA